MNTYTTKKGNTLKVEKVESDQFKGVPKYIFTLHEKKDGGENITILQSAYLTTPDYFTRKYLEEN